MHKNLSLVHVHFIDSLTILIMKRRFLDPFCLLIIANTSPYSVEDNLPVGNYTELLHRFM